MSRRKVMWSVLLLVLLGFSAISFAADSASHTVTIVVPEIDKIWADAGGTLQLDWLPIEEVDDNMVAYPHTLLQVCLMYVTNASDRKITAEASIPFAGLSLSVKGPGMGYCEELGAGSVTVVDSCIPGSVQTVTLTYDGKADITVPAGDHDVTVTYTITD